MKNHTAHRLVLIVGFALLLVTGFLLLSSKYTPNAQAVTTNLFVTPSGVGVACSQMMPCSLATALSLSLKDVNIYLAAGTYTGSGPEVVKVTKSIALYGGWNGAALGRIVINPDLYVSVLDGENARRVVFIDGVITPTLQGIKITRGNATQAPESPGLGGGVYARNARPVIQHNTIISNVSCISPSANIGKGAGIYLENAHSSTLIVNNEVSSNTAGSDIIGYGGGVYVSDGAPQILNNHIHHNQAHYGGGIMLDNTSAMIRGNSLVQNTAAPGWNGAGIIVFDGSPTIDANSILSNTADSAGEITLLTPDLFTVTNNVIARNKFNAIQMGNMVQYGLIAHNTIAYNGGGIYLAFASITPTILSNIIVSNTYGIRIEPGAAGTLDYNDVWGNSNFNYSSGVGLEPGPHSLQVDPLFVNVAVNNFHLLAESECVDHGIDIGVSWDIDGMPRPIGPGFEIGAYELPLYGFLPLVSR